MHYIDYTMDFLKNKLKENCVLCVGFGDNPYFKYDSDIKHEHDEIFILESSKKNNDKTIIITDKDIEKIEIDKNIPIFMSRVFEHLWFYAENISHLSKITKKLYLVVLLPKPWFTINEMSRIENINGYPHLFLEVSVNEELPIKKARQLFKYNYSKPLTQLETIIDIKKLTDYPGLIHRDNADYWDIEVTSKVSPNESVMVLENNFADVNTSDSGYCVYSLSGCIPKGPLIIFIHQQKDLVGLHQNILKLFVNGKDCLKKLKCLILIMRFKKIIFYAYMHH